eukprot:11810037-Alexandrium_andersonii.AAC.1
MGLARDCTELCTLREGPARKPDRCEPHVLARMPVRRRARSMRAPGAGVHARVHRRASPIDARPPRWRACRPHAGEPARARAPPCARQT